MPNFSTKVIAYGNEIERTVKYIKEMNAITKHIHKHGNISEKNIHLYSDNWEVFSVKSWKPGFTLFTKKELPELKIEHSDVFNKTCKLSFSANSQSITVNGDLMYIDYAYLSFDELYFQYSTVHSQETLDTFELAMYLNSIGLNLNFVLSIDGLNLETIQEVNDGFDLTLKNLYEKFGSLRVLFKEDQ